MLSQLNRKYSDQEDILTRNKIHVLQILLKWITEKSKMKITFAILFVLACGFAVSSAYPERYTIDRFDGNYPVVYDDRHIDDFNRNSRLRRQYYAADEGYHRSYYPSYPAYTAPIRREDANIERGLKFTPLVRYKSTRTKRKKLFVPNLWG